jgi:GNAT superfamily N-acetyltransferase
MEQAAARAWPSVETRDVEGWLWRSSRGGSRRANSVLPLVFTGRDVDAAIDRVEALYAAQRLPAYFQVSSISEPEGLDARLEKRGYTYEEPVLLMAKPLDAAEIPATIEIAPDPTSDWLAVYGSTLEPVRRAMAPETLTRVPSQRAFLLVRRESLPLASALCVVSPDNIAIVECVATEQSRRRTGAAREVMDALEAWAASVGATTVALQVVETNAPARALYAARGYTPVGRYHYRWRAV